MGGGGGTVTISGGTVTAIGDSRAYGIGSGYLPNAPSGFSTGANGNAFIVANEIEDLRQESQWNGVIFGRHGGGLYGSSVTLENDAELPADRSLTIGAGQQLTISAGVDFVNHSEININEGGAFTNRGSMENRGLVYVHSGFSNQGEWANLPTGVVYECAPEVLLNKGLAPGQYVALGGLAPIGDLVVSGGTILQDFQYDKKTRVLTIMGDGLTVGMRPGATTAEDSILVVGGGSVVESLTAERAGADAPLKLTLDGVSIDVSNFRNSCALALKYDAEVELTLVGDNHLTSGVGCAGLMVPRFNAITIGGSGSLTATGGRYGAGIGDGRGGGADGNESTVNITITGGTVTTTGGQYAVGIGDGFAGNGSTFSTGEGGSAIILANSIGDSEDTSGWSGVIFMDGTGQFYTLKAAVLEGDLTIPEGTTLTISEDETLTVNAGVTLTNHGRIINSGTVLSYGVIAPNAPEGSGTVVSVPQVTVVFALKDAADIPIYQAEHGRAIIITATVRRPGAPSQRSAVPGAVDFYLGSVERGIKLNGEPVPVSGEEGIYTAALEVELSKDLWAVGTNTVTADFGGMAGLLDGRGSDVFAIKKPIPPPPGGDVGGGGGGGGAPNLPPVTVTKPDLDNPGAPTNADVWIGGKVDQGGSATVRIPDGNITAAIKAANQQAGQGGISVSVNIHLTQTANSLTVTLSKAALDRLIQAEVKELRITGNLIGCGFNLEALQEIGESVTGDLTFTAKKVDADTLSEEARAMIGSRPVLDLTVGGGSKAITDFGSGLVSVQIPYTPVADEMFSLMRAVYVSGDGKASYLPGSRYDAAAKSVVFSTNHLSLYGVGHDPSLWSNPFADVPEHAWYFADVRYVVTSGLFSGTSATTFSPEGGMTRSMLWTVLARMDAQEVSGGETWYAKAADWAVAEGISDGTNPDGNMTREQLAVMLYRFTGSERTAADLSAYHDTAELSGWASDAVQWAVAHEIMLGKTGSLAPKDTISRAEAAAMLSRAAALLR